MREQAAQERHVVRESGRVRQCTLQSAPCVFKSVLLVDFLTFACSSFCLRPSSADSSADSRSSWAGGLPLDEDIDESEADVGAAGEAFIEWQRRVKCVFDIGFIHEVGRAN